MVVRAVRALAVQRRFSSSAVAKVPFVDEIARREDRLAQRRCSEGAGSLGVLASLIDYLSLPAMLVGASQLPSRAKGKNISALAEGSHTAESTTNARMIAHCLGFGPDSLAAALSKAKHHYSAFEPSVARAKWQYTITGRLPGHSFVRKYELESPKRYCALSTIQIRTCFMDDVVECFVEKHPVSNVVLLGSGLDSRFFRLKSLRASDVRKYEVDGAGSQKQKLSRLSSAGLDASAVTFVPCDFEAESWLDLLIAVGLDTKLPTVVLWEGVCMYISQKAVEATLRAVATGFSAEAAIAFDYITPGHQEQYSAILSQLGESLLFGAEAQDMVDIAMQSGLSVLDHAAAHELLELYMPPEVGLSVSCQRLMLAGNRRFIESSSS